RTFPGEAVFIRRTGAATSADWHRRSLFSPAGRLPESGPAIAARMRLRRWIRAVPRVSWRPASPGVGEVGETVAWRAAARVSQAADALARTRLSKSSRSKLTFRDTPVLAERIFHAFLLLLPVGARAGAALVRGCFRPLPLAAD